MIGEMRVNPDALTGRHKMRKDKAERMESVLEGRQDRQYGAAAGRRKQKTGKCARLLQGNEQGRLFPAVWLITARPRHCCCTAPSWKMLLLLHGAVYL